MIRTEQKDNATSSSSLSKSVVAGSLALAAAAMPQTADAALMRDIALDPQHRALGQSYLAGGSSLALTGGAAVSFRILVPGVGSGQRNTSAVMLNQNYAITAYHNVADLLQFNPTYEIATGPNYMNDRGTVRSIVEVIPYPGNSFNNPNLPDLCLLRLSSPLAGVQDAMFGSAVTGNALTMAGFGNYGSPAAGVLPRDGNVRGFRGIVGSSNDAGYSTTFYRQANIGSTSVLSLEGRGLSGDSGGAVFNSNGQLVGIMEAGTLGTNIVGTTVFSRLDTPEINSWITSTIPEPSSMALFAALGTGAMVRRRRV